jgi:hypothetical protein
MSDNIELLELIAELNMSDDKSRQALGAEIKRLTSGMIAERDNVRRLIVEASSRLTNAVLSDADLHLAILDVNRMFAAMLEPKS